MPEKKKWTLIFYLACDNLLAPGVMSQLKAIKSAGFHKQANVIVQFDPYTEDTPTHIFDVNITRKLTSKKESDIGFRSNDSYVHNLIEDKLWRNEKDRNGVLIRDRIKQDIPDYNPEIPQNGKMQKNGVYYEPGPKKSLSRLLSFCAEAYPAEHYILFLLGHGIVVGNDVFLFDEHAEEQTLSLGDLRKVLGSFKSKIKDHEGTLELVSFHSCSVSSLEVAYELKNIARFMLASQGTTYIGNLPYRQILIRIFNSLRGRQTPEAIKAMLTDIFSYCLHNSTDFLLGGYPFDICLSDLNAVAATRRAMGKLAEALEKGLKVPALQDAMLLAHLKAQSFHQEMYTDIIDFCRCLYLRTSEQIATPAHEKTRTELRDACKEVVNAIRNSIVASSFAGPEHQYAKGLSIYFPWSKPSEDLLEKYANYKFSNSKQDKTSWLDFLKAYFTVTRRETVHSEAASPITDLGEQIPTTVQGPEEDLWEDRIALVYTQAAAQTSAYALDGRPVKADSTDPMGGCGCPSIKNYPRDTRKRRERKRAEGRFALDPEFFTS